MEVLNRITALKLIGVATLLAMSGHALAAPGDVLFFDDFERSNPGVVGNSPAPLVGTWVVTPANSNAACSGQASSPAIAATPATIAISGSQLVPVNGITVGVQQIMAASYSGSTNANTVATNIVNQINACTAAITGNCTVSGYSASRGGSTVTINGPSTASGTPVVVLGTPSGGGTAETFVATAFAPAIPAVATGNKGCAGIDSDVQPWNAALSPRANNTRSLFTRWATVTVDSPVINLAGKAGAQVTYWVRRGSDCFSEWPGNNQAGCNAVLTPFTSLIGEEFQTQYKNSAGTWVVLSQYPTDALPGEIFRPVIDLPADALWSGFQLRFRQPSGSGFGASNGGAPGVLGYDYWHVDDVKITELAATNYVGAFCDTFEGDLSRWTFTGTGNAAIGSTYFQNGAHDLDIRWGPVTVTSKPADMTGATGNIQYWIKRGVGNVTTAPNTTGSDFPETGKDLVIEYLTTTAGVWKALVPANTFAGGGTAGQVWTPAANSTTNSIAIPADANRASFQLRFRFLAGAGYDQDYWHVDDVCLGTVVTGTDLILSMTPIGGSTTTLAPGATSTITFTVTNNGPNTEPGAISIIDTLPVGLSFVSNGNWSSGGWPSGQSSCTTVGQDVTCSRAGILAPGASTTITITVQADALAAGNVTNSARVGGQSLETVPANNTATNYYTFAQAVFEAYETNTTPATATSGRIFTKLAGTPFSLDVIAINGAAINTVYNKAVTVDLIDGTLLCASATAALAGVTVSSPAQPYTYTAGDSGIHVFILTSTKAYPDVRVRMKDNASTGCSSDHFAIRPSAFTITSADATDNAATGIPVFKAGATSFNLTAASVVGYNGTPVIDNTKVQGSPTAGSISGVFAAASAATGTASGSSFTYSEAGNFGLNANAVNDPAFTNVDQSGDCVALSFSNTPDASGKFGCSIGSAAVAQTTGSSGFGRFIPDHFETAINLVSGVPMLCPTNLPAGFSCPILYNGFVYSGQAFTTQVTARNLAGGTTQNYAGNYARAVTLSAWNGIGTATAPAGTLTNNSISAATFVAGVATTSTPVHTLPASTVPTNIYLRATETAGGDGVTSLLTTAANSIEGGVMVVSGRIKVANAYGSELLPLTLAATAQYYTAGGWLTSKTDGATLLTLPASYAIGSGTSSVTLTPSTGKLSNGALSIKLGKPGVAGSATVTPVAPGYLTIIPGTATFGVYKGTNGFIYQRESY